MILLSTLNLEMLEDTAALRAQLAARLRRWSHIVPSFDRCPLSRSGRGSGRVVNINTNGAISRTHNDAQGPQDINRP